MSEEKPAGIQIGVFYDQSAEVASSVNGFLTNFLMALTIVIGKRAARTVLTGMCYSVGSATRQGSSSLTRFIGQSAMTSRT